MKKALLLSYLFSLCFFSQNIDAQYYYPPVGSTSWDTVSPASIGWCTTEVDTLYDYLETRNSKSFIVLHQGKIAMEKYMNGFAQDSVWYWASAGKSLMAFLIGMAQEDGLLDINDKTSQYLGNGWTSAPQAKEDLITIWHQLTMTTGLDYNVPNQNCLDDTCLNYLHDAGTHWYYYNAPYRLTQDVLEAAVGKNITLYTFQSLNSVTGMSGFWFSHIFFSKARSMARFGLLNLSEGKWNGSTILGDTAYFHDMISPSQSLNEAYGYLWWLNGGSTYKQPGTDLVFNGQIIATAPADLYMAAGANDQRIYIVPSLDLVVVRQGDEAYNSQLALSQFDSELWSLLMNVVCNSVGEQERKEIPDLGLYPNPATNKLHLEGNWSENLKIINSTGQKFQVDRFGEVIDIQGLVEGSYILLDSKSAISRRFTIKR